MSTNNAPTFDAVLEMIASKELFIDTLEQRNSDSLDFHEVGVMGVRRALRLAAAAGRAWDLVYRAAVAEINEDIDEHLELLEKAQETGDLHGLYGLARAAAKKANQ